MIAVLAVLAALGVQQPRPVPATTTAELRTPHDSTVAAITGVAASVASLKSGLDQFQRAVFNEASGAVIQRAGQLQARCQGVVDAVARHERAICRNCLDTRAQPAVNAYRADLPALTRLGRQCVTRLTRRGSGTNTDSAAARLRREFRPLSATIVEVLRAYELRVEEVRRGFNASVVARPRS